MTKIQKNELLDKNYSIKCDYLLLGNTHPKLQLAVLNQIESEPFIILDTFKLYMDIANADLKKMISKSNLLCINYNEAVHLSGLKNHSLNEIADNILGLGSDSLIIKQGEDGATFFDKTTSFSLKAYPVNKVMDTTGAGDAFASGFLYGILQGWDLYKSCRMGNASGAQVVTKKGCANFGPQLLKVSKKVTWTAI